MISIDELSDREKEILGLVATGVSNKEISQELVISINTVKVHLRNIYQKLDVASRTEATYVAIQAGLILPDTEKVGVDSIEKGEGGGNNNIPNENFWEKPNLRILLLLSIVSLVLVMTIVIGYQLLNQPDTSITPGIEQTGLDGETIERWEAKRDLPLSINDFATAMVDNQLYVLAGRTDNSVIGDVFRYESLHDDWSDLTSKTVPVAEIDGAVIGNRIYISGGSTLDDEVTTILEVYDPSLDQWSTLADLPEPRSRYSTVAFEGRLYLFGGWDGDSIQDTVFIYDPSNDVWETGVTEMPQPIMDAGAVVANGNIYLIGGESESGPIDNTYVYRPALGLSEQNPWLEAMALDFPRVNMAAVSVADLVYIFGGALSPDDSFFSYQYSPSDNLWQPIEGPVDSQVIGLGAESMDSFIYTIGGTEDGKLVSGVFAYKALYTILIPVLR